jgi:hypothetical protein
MSREKMKSTGPVADGQAARCDHCRRWFSAGDAVDGEQLRQRVMAALAMPKGHA